MSSLTRMLSVLDLFSREHASMSAEEIAEALKLTRTTCYRYTKELASAGLLVSNGGRFTLGPRIIQLDHRIRESDPLLNAGRPVLEQLARALGATGLMATIYKSEIINIFQCGSEEALRLVTYGRGTSVPTFRSSSSKVILAALSRARLRRIWSDNAQDPDCQAIGTDWLAFWQALQAIKRNGYWISRSEVDSSLVGIAAPVLYSDGDVAGSMTLIFKEDAFSLFDAGTLGSRLLKAAQEVSDSLASRQGMRSTNAQAG